MQEQIQRIIASLPELDDVNSLCDMAGHRLTQGDGAFVADLGIALFKAYGSADSPIWQYRSVFDSIQRLLVISAGPEHLGHALRLLGATGSGVRKKARYAASLLASSRSAKDLSGVFAGGSAHAGGFEELRSCLVHELVLREETIDDLPRIGAWATSRHWAHHPLRWLPLSRSAVEEGHALPSYSIRGSAYSMPFGPSDDKVRTVPARNDRLPSAVETTTPAAADEMARAVANWAEESNGRIEARSFELSEPTESIAGLLPTLNLDCLAANGRRPAISASACVPSRAWQILFAAASTGGAYSHGLYGAYGRLEAWKSMAGLTGTSDTSTFTEVERQVHDHRWFTFASPTKWFEQVAWDIGIAALSPDGRNLTVLAATDTD